MTPAITPQQKAEQCISELVNYYLVLEGDPKVSERGLFDVTFLFQTFLMSKMWALQESENMPMEVRKRMSEKAGSELRKIILTYTGIDMHDTLKNTPK